MVDCGGLENRWGRKLSGGSNPSPSAILTFFRRTMLVAEVGVRFQNQVNALILFDTQPLERCQPGEMFQPRR